MNKYIIGIIIGVCITVTVLSVWSMLSMKSRITNLETFATQVANLINQSQQEVKK